ncbi:MAG TPA: hypothetical protein VLH09_08400 [Bryobacteraceae bacterium]|nr:hypothetical protein [Bryobacteraceae bacterium]
MEPLRVRFMPDPRAHRGRVMSGEGPGAPVHAGSFLRKREIVLDTALLASPAELLRILTHEVYHFVWLRLGNPARASYENLVAEEIRRGARGELGWSSEVRKRALTAHDRKARTRRWRQYACESFCDTASWLVGGGRHPEFTLARSWRLRRRAWFCHAEALKRISV